MPIAGVIVIAMLLPIILVGAIIIPLYLGICASLYLHFGAQILPYLLNAHYSLLVFISSVQPMIATHKIDYLFVAPALIGAVLSLVMFFKTVRYFGRVIRKKEK